MKFLEGCMGRIVIGIVLIVALIAFSGVISKGIHNWRVADAPQKDTLTSITTGVSDNCAYVGLSKELVLQSDPGGIFVLTSSLNGEHPVITGYFPFSRQLLIGDLQMNQSRKIQVSYKSANTYYVESPTIATGSITTASIILQHDVYTVSGPPWGEILTITSTRSGEIPGVLGYLVDTNQVIVSGLASDASRNLEITYNVDRDETMGMVGPFIAIFVFGGIVIAIVYATWKGNNQKYAHR